MMQRVDVLSKLEVALQAIDEVQAKKLERDTPKT